MPATQRISSIGGGPATYSSFALSTRSAPSVPSTVYGPLPTNASAVCQVSVASAVGGTTNVAGVAVISTKYDAGWRSRTTRVVSSGASIATSSSPASPAARADAPSMTLRTSGAVASVAGSRRRSQERRTSSATSGEPSLKVRPSRSVNRYVSPSSLTSQPDASDGYGSPVSSRRVSPA